ncbi:MAG TPA: PPOX class F420-dependent oxidoreductase [Methylomirabilota bacterium]|nr:PPOX class F420-dependent oxidoreductase [Methylomirabilota bacterium]
MATFKDKELDYLRSQRLARLATADSNGAPHVVPVGFRVSEDVNTIEAGGHGFGQSKKYRDMRANPRVAIVIDDLASVSPWTPRGIEIRGTAELQDAGGVERFGPGWYGAWVRITPERIVTWGIEAPPFTESSFQARSIPRWGHERRSVRRSRR